MFRSDESFRLEPLKTEIRGTRAAQPRRRTRSISRACPRRTATRAPARRARLLARPRRTSARFVRARGRGARGERARPLALPPAPSRARLASRPAGIPAVNGQGAGDVTFARISRSGPRDRPRALATRALARVPPAPPPRDGVVRRRRARDARGARVRVLRARHRRPEGAPARWFLRPGRPRRRPPGARECPSRGAPRIIGIPPRRSLLGRRPPPRRARPLRDERQRR